MKNKTTDLHNRLFEQLERLTDDDLDFDKEVRRAQAVCGIAMTITAKDKAAAVRLAADFPETGKKMPLPLEQLMVKHFRRLYPGRNPVCQREYSGALLCGDDETVQ